MPIYAYKCESCGHGRDVLQKLSDPVLTVCPACGQESFKKQLTAAGFQLKGSGWYVTDFRGGSSGTSAAASPPSGDSASTPAGAPAAGSDAAAPAAPAAGCGTSCACH